MTTSPADRRSGALESRWRQALETAPEVYVALDGEVRIADWNKAASALFAVDRDHAVGLPITSFVVAAQREPARAALLAAVSLSHDGRNEPVQLDLVTHGGDHFAAECLVWGVDRRGSTLAHCFVRDVTERRRTQQTAALLAAVVEGSADAIISEDATGRIRSWNAAAARMYGWTAEAAIGASSSIIVPLDRLPEHAEMIWRVFDGAPVRGLETERVSRAGTRIPVEVRMSPVPDASGRIVAVSTVARDVTEQRWMAETLDSTLLQLQTALVEAQEAEASSRRFLADAAHQLRTPLAGIRGCAELLLRGAAEEDRDRLLAVMVRETTRSAHLITALLRIARLDQGEPLPSGEVDVAQLCRDEVERLSLLAPDLEFVLDLSDAPSQTLPLDSGSCREILSNLADNARRHASSRITFTVTTEEQRVLVRVSDDGPGVADEDRDRIFERFVSLDRRGGSGLGLPIARGLAQALGGELCYADGFVLDLPRTTGSD
jgi:PAS domain S-box-containing protein